MAYKLCPNGHASGPRKKQCDTCGYIWTNSSSPLEYYEDSEDSEEKEPIRTCAFCGDEFSPKFRRSNLIGEHDWIWEYTIYCSSGCMHDAEQLLFNEFFTIFTKNPSIVSNEKIAKILTITNFKLKNETDQKEITNTNFIRLNFPLEKHIPDSNLKTPEQYEKVFKRKPPKIPPSVVIDEENIEEISQKELADISEVPLGDYLDELLSDKKVMDKAVEKKEQQKPGRGQKRCRFCSSIIGAVSKKCPNCTRDLT